MDAWPVLNAQAPSFVYITDFCNRRFFRLLGTDPFYFLLVGGKRDVLILPVRSASCQNCQFPTLSGGT